MQNFARELRLQCMRKGSIAQLCKATGINRQQFNKYLAGQILPGARTMRRICAYLGVSEAQLLRGETSSWVPVSSAAFLETGDAPSSATSAGVSRGLLSPGFYRSSFPVYGRPNLVARWVVHIRDEPGGGQSHSCRNHIAGGAALGYPADHLRYSGPIRYSAEEACLIGTAHMAQPLHGIVFVNLRPVAGEDYFSAMVMTRRAGGPVALSGVLQFLGAGCSAREALSGMGIFSLDDPDADPVTVRVIRAAPPPGPNWIQSVNEGNLQADRPFGGSTLPEALLVRRLSV